MLAGPLSGRATGSISANRDLATLYPTRCPRTAEPSYSAGRCRPTTVLTISNRKPTGSPWRCAKNKPFLGICLGAQMLARHLGARVFRDPYARAEIGYHDIIPLPAITPGVTWPQPRLPMAPGRLRPARRRKLTGHGRRAVSKSGLSVRLRRRHSVSSRDQLRPGQSLVQQPAAHDVARRPAATATAGRPHRLCAGRAELARLLFARVGRSQRRSLVDDKRLAFRQSKILSITGRFSFAAFVIWKRFRDSITSVGDQLMCTSAGPG